MGVSLNRPFEGRLPSKCAQWMSSEDADVTNSCTLKTIDIVTLSEWVKEA